jgi:hypothetical protein
MNAVDSSAHASTGTTQCLASHNATRPLSVTVHAVHQLALPAYGTNTLSAAKQLCSALQGDQAHSPTDYSACRRSTGASSYICAGHARPLSLTHLALRADLGAQGTAPEVTPRHHLAAPDDTALSAPISSLPDCVCQMERPVAGSPLFGVAAAHVRLLLGSRM